MKFLREFFNSNQRILLPLTHSVLWFCSVLITLFGDKYIIPNNVDYLRHNLYGVMFAFVVFLSEVSIAFFDIGFSDYKKSFNSKVFKHFGFIVLDLVIAFILGVLLIKSGNISIMFFMIIMLSAIKYISSYMMRNKDVYFEKNRGCVYTSNDLG